MRWYEGGIAEAVSLSRKNNSIFVVYVEGNDDTSAELTKILDTEEVSSKLESDSFVTIKIEANSVPHQQFSEIYNKVNVPSIYFIGKSGAPLEIIEVANGTDEFVQKIDNILKKNGSPIGSSAPNKSQVTSDFIAHETKAEAANENAGTTNEAASSSGAVTEAKPNQEESVSNSTEETSTLEAAAAATDKQAEVEVGDDPEVTHEDKVERAKALIEKKRQEKQQEDEERERNKEIERRKMGQDVQKMKRWQQDQELKNIIEEREREKKEQMAARQRILAQIEQDKADRAARFSGTAPIPQAQPQPPIPRTPTNNNTARLQFKLPDGSSHTHEFSNTSSLLEVRNYIKSNLNLSFNNFTLATTFPRREFTGDDDSQTLQDLELVPTAVILILPIPHGTVASNPSAFTAYLWYLIAPFLNLLGYLKGMIFPERKPQSPEPSTSQENKRPHDGSSESSRPLPKRRVAETSVIRRQGNVHRLTDKSDSDDENNTWNGNSTQQM